MLGVFLFGFGLFYGGVLFWGDVVDLIICSLDCVCCFRFVRFWV